MKQLEAASTRVSRVPPAAPRPVTRRKAVWWTSLAPYSFILPIAVFALLLLAYPMLYSLTLSFRDATVDTFVSGDMPFNGVANYQQTLSTGTFWQALVNTIIFTFCSILFQFTIGFLLALFFQKRFPLKNVLIALLLILRIAPVVTAAYNFAELINQVRPQKQLAHRFAIPTQP